MKNYIPTYEDFVNEDILNDPKAKLWDTKYRINYDDLPANMDLRTPYLDKLFKGIPYQHYAFPQVSDDGNLIFKNQRDLDKAKKILSGIHESTLNEAAAKQFDKDVETLIKNIKRGYGWIEPEYVVDSWDNVSDTISFDLVKGEVLKRLFNAGLLYHSSANGKDKGAKVTLSELGALALMKESSVNEAQFFKATKDFEEFLEEIDGMPESRIRRIIGNKYIDTPGGYRDEAEDYDNDIVEYMIANMGRKEFEKLHDYWETNIKESSTFIAESAMGDIHIMAEESATFDEFKAEFVKEYGISKKDNNKELHDWLQGIWKENHKK
jgi:hypothetical protein